MTMYVINKLTTPDGDLCLKYMVSLCCLKPDYEYDSLFYSKRVRIVEFSESQWDDRLNEYIIDEMVLEYA